VVTDNVCSKHSLSKHLRLCLGKTQADHTQSPLFPTGCEQSQPARVLLCCETRVDNSLAGSEQCGVGVGLFSTIVIKSLFNCDYFLDL